jgi:hypothetical protein
MINGREKYVDKFCFMIQDYGIRKKQKQNLIQDN